jgi:hypothetical protein
MSSRSITYFAPLIALCAATLAATPALAADPIVFTSWGGTTQSSQQKNWAAPFTQATGINVLMDGPTDYGKLKAMVDSGNVNWDVVDVEGDFAYAAQQAGLIEPIDYSVVKKDELDPRFATPAAVGSFYYSFVLGYNKAKYKDAQPSTWADLFDTKKFPGKRTLYKWSAPGVLEIALLADGVPPNKLYPLDLDRAFKKLDTIKSDIVWWRAIAAIARIRRSAYRHVLERATACARTDGRACRHFMEPEPDGGRHARDPEGREAQGGSDEVPRCRNEPASAGEVRNGYGLCAYQREVGRADVARNREDAARPVQELADQSRHEVLGRESRRDCEALVRVAVQVSVLHDSVAIVIGVDGRHHA